MEKQLIIEINDLKNLNKKLNEELSSRQINIEKNAGKTFKIENTLDKEIERLTSLNSKLNKEINIMITDIEKLKKV